MSRFFQGVLWALCYCATLALSETCKPCEPAQIPNPCTDLYEQNLTSAFSMAMDKLKELYAFKNWKNLDFDMIKKNHTALVEAAQKETKNSTQAHQFYLALTKVVMMIPDKHVSLEFTPRCEALAEDAKARYEIFSGIQEPLRGTFGFTTSPLDDGTVIVTYVDPKGKADLAGIKSKWVLTEVDGKKVDVFAGDQEWLYSNSAKTEERRLNSYRLVTQGTINSTRNFTFNESNGTLGLSAVADKVIEVRPGMEKGQMWSRTGHKRVVWMAGMDPQTGYPVIEVKTHLFPGGVGYIGMAAVLWKAGHFEQAVKSLIEQGAKGLLIDIRGNAGGFDQLVPEVQGVITQENTSEALFYEHICYPNALLHSWCVKIPGLAAEEPACEVAAKGNPDDTVCAGHPAAVGELHGTLVATPSKVASWAGPVVALTNSDCVSSGEGIAMVIKRLGKTRGAVVGYSGTAGSFGMAGATIHLPHHVKIDYAFGSSNGIDGKIQVESNHTGVGGVAPTHKIPMTADHMTSYASRSMAVNLDDLKTGKDEEFLYAQQVLKDLMSAATCAIYPCPPDYSWKNKASTNWTDINCCEEIMSTITGTINLKINGATEEQVKVAAKKTLAKQLGVTESAVAVTVTESRRLEEFVARRLAGDWKIDYVITVGKTLATATTAKATAMTNDEAALTAEMATQLKAAGASDDVANSVLPENQKPTNKPTNGPNATNTTKSPTETTTSMSVPAVRAPLTALAFTTALLGFA